MIHVGDICCLPRIRIILTCDFICIANDLEPIRLIYVQEETPRSRGLCGSAPHLVRNFPIRMIDGRQLGDMRLCCLISAIQQPCCYHKEWLCASIPYKVGSIMRWRQCADLSMMYGGMVARLSQMYVCMFACTHDWGYW